MALLDLLVPFTRADKLSRLASFVSMAVNHKTQKGVFDHLTGSYPPDTRFVLLSMDMKYMGAGDPPREFEQQLDELAEIKKDLKDRVIPFIAVDPRRKNIFDLVQKYIETKGFGGIKLYPSLGFWPFDAKLDDIYDYALANDIPILTHTTRGGIYYQGRIKKEWLTHPKTGKPIPRQPNWRFCDVFSDPVNYEDVLKDRPKLKLCLAHFGGIEEWNAYLRDSWHSGTSAGDNWVHKIRGLIARYENVFTDISYTLSDERIVPLLKLFLLDPKLRQKILFGTDFYMVELEKAEKKVSVDFRAAIGEPDFQMMAAANPNKFL